MVLKRLVTLPAWESCVPGLVSLQKRLSCFQWHILDFSRGGRDEVDGVTGVWRTGLGHLPRKNHFCPQNAKFGHISTQFLTDRKHRKSRELCKNYQKNSQSAQVGGNCSPASQICHCLFWIWQTGAHYIFLKINNYIILLISKIWLTAVGL